MSTERDRLREEIAALDAEQTHIVLMFLVGSDPDTVRAALDTERATRRAKSPAYCSHGERWNDSDPCTDDERAEVGR